MGQAKSTQPNTNSKITARRKKINWTNGKSIFNIDVESIETIQNAIKDERKDSEVIAKSGENKTRQ